MHARGGGTGLELHTGTRYQRMASPLRRIKADTCRVRTISRCSDWEVRVYGSVRRRKELLSVEKLRYTAPCSLLSCRISPPELLCSQDREDAKCSQRLMCSVNNADTVYPDASTRLVTAQGRPTVPGAHCSHRSVLSWPRGLGLRVTWSARLLYEGHSCTRDVSIPVG